MRSLVSFVGNRDPYPDQVEDVDEPGPLLAFLLDRAREGRHFDEAWLLCTAGSFFERARDLERELHDEGLPTRIVPIEFALHDVIDYSEIWSNLERVLPSIRERSSPSTEWSFLFDSGTPQAKGCLLLAARSGLFPATLIQGIPARFAGGTYKAREIRLEGFPDISMARPSKAPSGAFGQGLGAFAEIERQALGVAGYDDPVLILGSTGTGKTRIARIIHDASPRKGGPFVELNCSAIPAALAESELFGHVRGAFTGTDRARTGKFRAAAGGTLFLDEIGDLPLELQAKLLKALDQGRVTPVGSDDEVKTDARIIAATNHDLEDLIAIGKFRRDLYERLKVVVVRMLRLAERVEDIRPQATTFLEEWNLQYSEHRFLTEEALLALEGYSWPGNVRELINTLRSAACTANGLAIGLEVLPAEIRAATRGAGARAAADCIDELPAISRDGVNLRAKLLQVEWGYIQAALRQTENNREAAAKLLGLTGHALRKALRERLAGFVEGES
ncbi:MAG: sigma 54-interacting transcriptional regulator [Rectinemataceae bacterium]